MPENLGDILGQEHLTTIKALNDKVDKLQNELTMIKSDAIKLLKSITGASDESGVDLQSFVKKKFRNPKEVFEYFERKIRIVRTNKKTHGKNTNLKKSNQENLTRVQNIQSKLKDAKWRSRQIIRNRD